MYTFNEFQYDTYLKDFKYECGETPEEVVSEITDEVTRDYKHSQKVKDKHALKAATGALVAAIDGFGIAELAQEGEAALLTGGLIATGICAGAMIVDAIKEKRDKETYIKRTSASYFLETMHNLEYDSHNRLKDENVTLSDEQIHEMTRSLLSWEYDFKMENLDENCLTKLFVILTPENIYAKKINNELLHQVYGLVMDICLSSYQGYEDDIRSLYSIAIRITSGDKKKVSEALKELDSIRKSVHQR